MPKVKVTKEEIIKRASKVFIKKGYHNSSISDLAEACEIHNAHFYYYFTNKEDLMSAVLSFVQEYVKTRIEALIDTKEVSPKGKLKLIIAFFEKHFTNHIGGCIMANTTLEVALFEPKFIPIIKDFFEVWTHALKEIYLSKYPEEQAQELAEATVQDIEGGIMLMKLYKNNKYLLNSLKRSEKLLD